MVQLAFSLLFGFSLANIIVSRMTVKYTYKYLSDGNADAFETVSKDLKDRGVRADVCTMHKDSSGRMWRIPIEDIDKLYKETLEDGSKKYYIDGFRLGDIFNPKAEKLWENSHLEWYGGPWKPV